MDNQDKIILKQVLEDGLERKAIQSEVVNAQTDVGLLVPILLQKITDLDKRVTLLEGK